MVFKKYDLWQKISNSESVKEDFNNGIIPLVIKCSEEEFKKIDDDIVKLYYISVINDDVSNNINYYVINGNMLNLYVNEGALVLGDMFFNDDLKLPIEKVFAGQKYYGPGIMYQNNSFYNSELPDNFDPFEDKTILSFSQGYDLFEISEGALCDTIIKDDCSHKVLIK